MEPHQEMTIQLTDKQGEILRVKYLGFEINGRVAFQGLFGRRKGEIIQLKAGDYRILSEKVDNE